MPISSSLLVVLALIATPAASETDVQPTAANVRQSVERSLVFLETSGMNWWTKSKCASCHHVPMSVWSMSEAKNRGLAVNDNSLEEMRTGAIASYVNHPKLRPVGQDGEEKGSSVSLNTIYLTQAASSTTALDETTTEALKKFTTHFLAAQEKDGSWKSSATLPPVGDITEVRTMQVLLALATAHERGLVETETWTAARDRALAWLLGNKFIDQNQSLNLQILVAKQFRKPEEVQPLVDRLLQQQEEDGGWSQTKERPKNDLKEYDEKKPAAPAAESKETATAGSKEKDPKDKEEKKTPAAPVEIKSRPSDALATGQTLYTLALAGVDSQHSAVQRAQAYLLRTQTKDGSWLVPFRSQKNSGRALTHYGTGWAAIGLMQSLPAAAGKPETAKLSANDTAK